MDQFKIEVFQTRRFVNGLSLHFRPDVSGTNGTNGLLPVEEVEAVREGTRIKCADLRSPKQHRCDMLPCPWALWQCGKPNAINLSSTHLWLLWGRFIVGFTTFIEVFLQDMLNYHVHALSIVNRGYPPVIKHTNGKSRVEYVFATNTSIWFTIRGMNLLPCLITKW